jgi:Uma2 family endonuclease
MATDIKTRMTFEDYLTYDDGTDRRYEWIDGVLVAMPTESEFNEWLSLALQLYFIHSGLVRPRLVKRFNCELEVPLLQPKQARNRFPDLVILRPEHIELTQKRLTIRLDMPPPVLVVKVVSPGKVNRDRDYEEKRAQYEAREIPEYWLLDPELETVTILTLTDEAYQKTVVKDDEKIVSRVFPGFSLTADQVLNPPE